MPDPNLPWQVIRVYHADGTTIPVCTHRTERRAAACAWRHDILAMLIEWSFRPRWSGDIRRTPQGTA